MARPAPCAAAVLLAALLTSCAGRAIETDEATVLVGERSGGGDDALWSGPLEVVGGCLGVRGAVVVFPHGTEVIDEDPLRVDIPGDPEAALGDNVSLGGGFVIEHSEGERAASGPIRAGGVEIPAACAAYDVFVSHAD